MKRKIITCVLTLVFVLCAFSTIAYAKNIDISFTLTPNGSSGYSGTGYKVDSDPKCYITTTGGSVISNNLVYKCRGKAITSSGYADATELSDPAYQGAITSETLYYIGTYYTNIVNGNWSQYSFILAASLHSGNPGQYNLSGRWNP